MKKYTIDKLPRNTNIYIDEWTAICDIGRVFHGEKLTSEEYKKTEDAYINAIYGIVDYMNINKLKIKHLLVVEEGLKDYIGENYRHIPGIQELYNDPL